MPQPLRVLLLEDSEIDAILLLRTLAKGGYDVTSERTDTADGLRALLTQSWDIILSDHNMKGFDSLSALSIVKETGIDVPFIIISGAIGEEVAVEAMKAGANDYLMKDRLTRLVPAIERELKEAEGRIAKRKAQDELDRTRLELEMSNQLLRAYTRKLEQSNNELEQFATVVSHDLQAPLRKITMFSEFLVEAGKDALSDEQRDYLGRIQKAVVRMQSLVTDLLSLSRVNRSEHRIQNVELGEVMHAVIDDLQAQIQSAEGRVEVGPMMSIEGNPVQLQQLLQNLTENALKFHKPGVPPVVSISAVPENGQCKITVQDNGIGFKAEHAETIFEVFQRLHGIDVYSGTGVGLAIVKKIVERHNGTIVALAEPDQGAKFVITLPLKQDAPTISSAHSQADEGKGVPS